MKVSELQKQTPRTLAIKVHQRELRIEYLENRISELEKQLNTPKTYVLDGNQVANMLRHQADYIKHLEQGLESSIALNKAQAERQNK